MEHEPRHNDHEGRQDEAREALRGLPDPETAAGVLTAILADRALDAIFEAQAAGTDIDDITARLITYNLIAHAPEAAATEYLREFFTSGTGTHEQLKSEYLPLRLNETMQPEGHLLVDALGSYLLNREQPADQHPRADRMRKVLFAVITRQDRSRVGLMLKTRQSVGAIGATALMLRLARIADQRGEAFLAYLRTPGVDAISQDVEGEFLTSYIGGTEELASIQSAPDTVDPALWHGVEIGGHRYVFHA